MNNRNSHNKAIIWTITSLLLWLFVAVAAKVLQFRIQASSMLSELLNGHLGIAGSILLITVVIIPMLLRSRYHAKQAKMQTLAAVLSILMLLCITVSLIFTVGLLL